MSDENQQPENDQQQQPTNQADDQSTQNTDQENDQQSESNNGENQYEQAYDSVMDAKGKVEDAINSAKETLGGLFNKK